MRDFIRAVTELEGFAAKALVRLELLAEEACLLVIEPSDRGEIAVALLRQPGRLQGALTGGIQDIILTPADGKIDIDVRGDLAGILTLSVKKQNPAAGTAGSQVKMVAGAGNGRKRHTLIVVI